MLAGWWVVWKVEMMVACLVDQLVALWAACWVDQLAVLWVACWVDQLAALKAGRKAGRSVACWVAMWDLSEKQTVVPLGAYLVAT